MAASPSTAPRDLSRISLLLALAVLVGIVAALLVAAAPVAPTPSVGQIVVQLPTTVWGLLLLAPFLTGLMAIVVQRLLAGKRSVGRGRVVLAAVGLAVAALIVLGILLAVTNPGPQGSVTVPTTPQPPAKNNTTPPPRRREAARAGRSPGRRS